MGIESGESGLCKVHTRPSKKGRREDEGSVGNLGAGAGLSFLPQLSSSEGCAPWGSLGQLLSSRSLQSFGSPGFGIETGVARDLRWKEAGCGLAGQLQNAALRLAHAGPPLPLHLLCKLDKLLTCSRTRCR